MPFRRRVAVPVLAMLLLALSGCGDDEAGTATRGPVSAPPAVTSAPPTTEPAGTEPPADPSADPETETSATTVEPVTREIGKTGWYDGFAITVVEAVAEPSSFGDGVSVMIEFSYQNLGTTPNYPADADILVDGEVINGLFDTPQIPGEGTAQGTAAVDLFLDDEQLTPDAALDSITLVYGDPGDNQTTIPLAEDADVDSVEPIVLDVTGQLSQSQILVDVLGGTLAPSYETGEEGKSLLNLRIRVSCAADCQAQGHNTDRSEFSITDPAGNSVVADDRSEYCCDAVYPGTVSDGARNVLTFVVASPGTGDYVLTYANGYLTSQGTATGTFAFSVG